ncbi:MAG: YfhO family protein [bacterium]
MSRSRAASVLGIVAFAALFFAPELFLGRVAMTSNMARWRPWTESSSPAERAAPSNNPDCGTSYYPRRWVLHAAWRARELPLWNPWSFCGTPFLADPQAEVLYPPSWILLPFDAGTQLGLFLFLHVAWGGIGAALLLRRHGVPASLATLGGCAFAVNGFYAKHLGQPPFLATASWIPWVLLATLDVAERPTLARSARLALAGAALFLAGQPQIALLGAYAAAVVGLVAILRGRVSRGDRAAAPNAAPPAALRLAVALGFAGALAALLAAAQLLPTLELARRSARADLPYATVLSGAFHPVDAIRFVVEEFFGTPVTGDEWAFLFPRGDGFYLRTQINSIFAGTPIFLLALWGMTSKRTRGAAAPFTALFVLAVAVAFGTPLARLAYRVLPGFAFARLDRAGALVVLAQIVPAGLAAADLAVSRGRARRAMGAAIVLGAAAFAILVAWAGTSLPGALGADPSRLPPGVFDPRVLAHTASRTAVCAVFAAGTGAAFLLPATRLASALPLALAVLQLFFFAAPYRGDRRREEVFAASPAIERLREVLGGDEAHGGGRFVRFGRDLPVRPYPTSSVLPPSTNVPYALRDLQGYNALADRALGETLERATGEPLFSFGVWAGRRIVEPLRASSLEHPLLDALAVSAAAGATLPSAHGWVDVPCGGFALARNVEALPRVRLALAGRGVSREELDACVAAGRLDPAREALWVGEGRLGLSESPGVSGADVEIVADSWNRLVARTHAGVETILVVADSFDPGWHATVDGGPAPILALWGVVRGVRLPAGAHVVTMTYLPRSFVLGGGLSLLGIVLAGAALAAPGNLVRRRRVL